MNTSKQVIILIDDKNNLHEFETEDKMNTHVRCENIARSTLFMDALTCENTKVFVGEKRWLKTITGKATTDYRLSGAGCECGG
jgi:hypothetical protein